MEVGLFMDTHGLGTRDETQWWLQAVPAPEMQPVEIAKLGEANGFHSLWFSDHVAMPPTSVPITYVNTETARRHYPERFDMLDGAVVMGAVATHTTRIKLAPSVLVSPYRPPMSDARQFATIDVLSNGRLIMGVGAGWCREEFEGLGLRFEDRSSMTEECIEIYKRAWTDDLVEFHGKHYDFANLVMNPKPIQKPHPPIVFGGVTKEGARRAARLCDGFYPIFSEPAIRADHYDAMQDEIRREAERIGRDLTNFRMLGTLAARITDSHDAFGSREPRPHAAGSVEQVLSDLEKLSEAGYSMMAVHMDCPTGTVSELRDRIAQFGSEIIPTAKKFQAKGEWRRDI